MSKPNKNMGNVPVGKCKVKGCKKIGIANCVFAGKNKGDPPAWSGHLCIDHWDAYHRKYTNGQRG